MQMYYRPPVRGQIHNIRAIADFSVKTIEVLALAREFDLVKTWNWTAADSAILGTRNEFDMDALAVLKMPWPYKHRFAAFSFKGGDFLDERACVTALFNSCRPVRSLLLESLHSTYCTSCHSSGTVIRHRLSWRGHVL
ncbi:MAG: hypothetical protein HC767_09020 [Akkermansiaceae bacterium]|nr:hypothetical protein [Akkermansiaceae bacterium]